MRTQLEPGTRTPGRRSGPSPHPAPMRRNVARLRSAALLSLLALAAGCSPSRHVAEWARLQELTPGALVATAARDPGLACGPRGRVALTWVSPAAEGADAWVEVSVDSGRTFAAPVRLNTRPGSVSSYAESRPVAAFGREGQLVVVWASARDSAGSGDDIVARASEDDGESFGRETPVNSDAGDPVSGYHGFTALAVTGQGRALVAWLDGRASGGGAEEPARATVRIASSNDGGRTWSADRAVAGEACPCCRLALAADTLGRVALAYRGARGDLRDPRLALSTDGGERFAIDTLVSADRWLLQGCPSIGPSVALDAGRGGAYAWFTASEQAADGAPPGSYVVRWRPEGALAGPRESLADSLGEATRPLLAPMGEGLLAAVQARPAKDSHLRVFAVRRLARSGARSPWIFLGVQARAGAIAAADGRTAYAAWVERGADGDRVRLVRLERR